MRNSIGTCTYTFPALFWRFFFIITTEASCNIDADIAQPMDDHKNELYQKKKKQQQQQNRQQRTYGYVNAAI